MPPASTWVTWATYQIRKTKRWRHNDHAGVSTHQPHGCLLNRLFRRKSKKPSKLRVTGFCAGNSPGTGEFPAQMASYVENVSIWWRHHDYGLRMRRECRERFPRHQLQRKPPISDPAMHHGTCVTHVSWCMSGSLNRGGGINVPSIPGACATRKFAYLARVPLCHSASPLSLPRGQSREGEYILSNPLRYDFNSSHFIVKSLLQSLGNDH